MTSLLVLVLLAAARLGAATIDEGRFSAESIIERDVAIIGGGAAGANAAVKLREDFKKSIVVVEKQGRLGGHVATHTEPNGLTYEYGVQSYLEYPGVRDFFARFNVSIGPPVRSVSLTSRYADFSSGANISSFVAPANTDRNQSLYNFLAVAEKYERFLLPGYFDFPAPDDIPEDLFLPFGEFAEKYDFLDAMPQMFQVPGPGVPDWVGAPTLHIMAVFGAPMARALTGQLPTFAPTSRNNTQLYGEIGKLLGSDVLYSSVVVESERSDEEVSLVVKSADGKETLIKAKKLLIAFEPTIEAMKPFRLDDKELAVFDKFDYSNVYAGIVSHPSLPVNVSLVNTVPDAAPMNYLNFPPAPILARFDFMGLPSELFRVLIVGEKTLDKAGAMALVRDSLARLIKAGTLPPGDMEDLKFVAFVDHGAMHLRAPVAEIKNGFIQRQYALQGHRATWYTGAAWSVQFTTILWGFNDVLLPKLVAAL